MPEFPTLTMGQISRIADRNRPYWVSHQWWRRAVEMVLRDAKRVVEAEPEEADLITLNCRVDNVELKVRSWNCLKNENIVYVGQLARMTKEELLRLPNFGRVSLRDVEEALQSMGLQLGMDLDRWRPPEDDTIGQPLDERESA